MMRTSLFLSIFLSIFLTLAALPLVVYAQQTPAPVTAKSAASSDFTGYWVSVVTEDWLYRMVTPAKGDYSAVPLNPAARKIADAWDPAKDEAAGEQCKAYGAPAIMRIPGRLHITWQDDNTLKIEKDSGTQTRLLHFGAAAAGPGGDWQGVSGIVDRGGRRSRSGERRWNEGRDHETKVGIFAQEWRSLQRKRRPYGILRSRE